MSRATPLLDLLLKQAGVDPGYADLMQSAQAQAQAVARAQGFNFGQPTAPPLHPRPQGPANPHVQLPLSPAEAGAQGAAKRFGILLEPQHPPAGTLRLRR